MSEKPPKRSRRTRRTKRPFGTIPHDFPPTKRDRLGNPDYYHKLSPSELEFIGKFNEEYVGANFVGRREDLTCEEDFFNTKEKRNEINREVNSAKRDLATRISVGRKVNPKKVVELSFAYADYLYVLSGNEDYLIDEQRHSPWFNDWEIQKKTRED